jgi:hypothetical protein
MSKKLSFHGHVFLGALGIWLSACSLDPDLPNRGSSAPPTNSGVTLSGAGTWADLDAAVEPGESSRITDQRRASAGGMPGAVNSGGAFDQGAKDTGGVPSSAGGASSSTDGAAGADDGVGGGDGGAAGGNAKDPPRLWFSEYVEGSSSNKALEITAHTRAVLDGCKVSTYFNGKSEAAVVATLSGVLEAGKVLTLCTSALKEKLAATCNQVGNLTFNGDDAVSLSCDGELLDVIGQIGTDPGEAWGSDPNSTADHTLRRPCTTEGGDPLGSDPFNPSPEWLVFPVDTFDGLGTRGC